MAIEFSAVNPRKSRHRPAVGSTRPTAVDLFSGCGGLTEGLKQAGFRVLGAVECDALAADTYEANHSDVHLVRKDIRRVSASRLMKELGLRKGRLALLAGCPPCQGFSAIRTRNGGNRVRDARNNLIYEFLRFVRVLKPKAIMMENVPALARDRRLKELVKSLSSLGYFCSVKVLDVAKYAVPQRRRRVVLLASVDGEIPVAKPSRCERSVEDAIGHLKGKTGKTKDKLHYMPGKRSDLIERRIRAIPKNGGSRSSLPSNLKLKCHDNTDGFKDVYGRMQWDAVAPTITGGCINPSKGRFLHPSEHRAITLREAALLQTFPRRYYFSLAQGRFPAALMIGNALPPEFVRRHASQVRKFLSKGVGHAHRRRSQSKPHRRSA